MHNQFMDFHGNLATTSAQRKPPTAENEQTLVGVFYLLTLTVDDNLDALNNIQRFSHWDLSYFHVVVTSLVTRTLLVKQSEKFIIPRMKLFVDSVIVLVIIIEALLYDIIAFHK